MKVLSVVGKADKRLLTYPLMHVLAFAGKTIVITDDVAYRHLYRGFTNEGVVNDILIRIIPDLDTDKITRIVNDLKENHEAEFDFCLVITDIHRCENADATICVCARSKSFLGTKLEDFSEKEPNVVKTFIGIDEINKKEWRKLGVMPLRWTSSRFIYVYECEEQKKLLPFDDKEVLNVIGTAFLKDLNINAKTFLHIAKRKLK